ncbi:hypothetical protein F5B22DRAFT_404586 [Xylaria bambusicola]|uniref:uncharacterized protein n=1 Tax=Xylaria bambusicola TaxID=326684 RepID=UPI0020081F2A|nr:uncharacterized protein F5B22DRAFT_404586 [Xylaria bambusicola]KAI0508407.1 hypothetical protein F5B22DRAFT_404586 [Xylaria bambusicola]
MNATQGEEHAAKRAQEALGRLLRPRSELIAERRVMAQDLAKDLGQEHLSSPMFLVDPDEAISSSSTLQERQRVFVESLQRNVELQRELSRLRAEHRTGFSATSPASSSTRANAERRLLEEQLECSRLEREHQKLEAFKKSYEEFNGRSAATPEFLDPNVMFSNCAPFPDLPKNLIEGFTKNEEAPHQEAEEMVLRLRKATFREKLILEYEQQQLNELKVNHSHSLGNSSPEAQMAALNAVKTSLVNWIENMLSKAGEGESGDGNGSSKNNGNEDLDRETQRVNIEKEYNRHIELRKQIMASVSLLGKSKKATGHEDVSRPPPAPVTSAPIAPEPQTYLLIPYLERLQSLSQEQRGLVQEKAHINTTISRQQQDTNKALRRLAQDSKLLSKYPQAKPENLLAGISFSKATKSASITDQIRPWLFAADSAKIVTLEAAAEAVDRGQMPLEDAMQALHQVSLLQDKGPLQAPEDGDAEFAKEDEISGTIGEVRAGKKRASKKPTMDRPKSIWSILDGNLGLINE